ncbi:tyrosine-type recombinase/integrase [Bacillus alkalicellulosilyticus]|uniref:tyrosine-type recombinase/integrase n=1 Tax=Alkalihalobacterium alkalicellulosilyticum TaxID=1912214 RepID=UPI001481ED24|nr:tyrosine-type recombinase/integrase [Bacillus alkalicellulosilyticus]
MNKQRRRTILWSTEEMGQFLEVAKQEGEELIFEFALFTGVRQGELLSLTWSDINFESGTCTVGSVISAGQVQNEILERKPSFRTVTLSRNLLVKLQKHKENQQLVKEQYGEHYHTLELVFPNNEGSTQSYYKFIRKFNRLIEKANVRKITFRDLGRISINSPYEMPIPLESLISYRGVESNTIKYYLADKIDEQETRSKLQNEN